MIKLAKFAETSIDLEETKEAENRVKAPSCDAPVLTNSGEAETILEHNIMDGSSEADPEGEDTGTSTGKRG